ncbi:MAG: shikimate dehydrogenase, partial [Prolixibacteraceae bacterium]|nr:shikimate dehydrogenase [Prolixibacteraceae bacterium]
TENKAEQYLNFEMKEISRLRGIIAAMPELVGLNVTIPHKTSVIPLLDTLDETAKAIGAVNTIKIDRRANGNIVLAGFNTDYYGFIESLKPLLKPHHTHALTLGTGGAAKAVTYALNKLYISNKMVSRESRDDKKIITYKQLNADILAEYLLIINTTPLGTFPDTDSFPAIPYDHLTPRHLLYDLVYNPTQTQFMKRGIQQGATVKNGFEMLQLQALKAYEIWNNR